MAITLGDLRTYCSEVASPDISGTSSSREFMTWINAALRRVWADHSWDHIQAKAKIYCDPEETGDNLTVTQGSLSISTSGGETIDTKYPTDQEDWTLIVTSEGRVTFKLASRDSATTGTLESGNEWTADTPASVSSYAWVRDTFPLPNNAKQLYRVQVLQSSCELASLSPDEFDYQCQRAPTQRGVEPLYYCVRSGNIEIWPPAGEDAKTIEISYRKAAPTYEVADADATEVDWPEEWADVLEKAIMLEASFYQGANSPVPYPLAKTEYLDRLNQYKGLDSKKDQASGPLSPRHAAAFLGRRFPTSYSGGVYTGDNS